MNRKIQSFNKKCKFTIKTLLKQINMMKKITFSALALSLCFSAFAQEPVNTAVIAKIRAEGLEKSKALEIAHKITDLLVHAYLTHQA